ncbi:MAG TPA: extracellular solute-binding protein [Clostridiaceae bacterium]|nr:extracellular solute-binding protein [Clostridiaceae bacterium]
MLKSRFVKLFTLMTIVLLVASLILTGCGKSSETGDSSKSTDSGQPAQQDTQDSGSQATSGEQKITVLLPKHEMDTKGFWEKETRQFESESGVKVELINMAWENVAERVTQEMAAGGSSYDVVEFDNAWVAKFNKNNWLEPLDGYEGADEIKNGLLSGLVNKFSIGGKFYGVAWNNDTRFFMYNKKMLEDAGISKPPKTWAEVKEYSKILQEKGIAKYGFIDAYPQSQVGVNEITYAIYSFGGNYFDENGNLIIASDPGVKNALEFLQKGLNEDKFIDPASLTSDYEAIANVFFKGDTAFFLQAWPGVYAYANDPSVSQIVGQIEVAPYAIGVDEKTNIVLTLPEAMAIPATSKNKENAWKYIRYMSSKEFDKRKALEIGALPIWKELYNDPDLLKLYPYWENFGKQAENARGLPDITWYDQFANIIQVEVQNILIGQTSVEDGLKSIEEQLKRVME